MDKLAWDFLLYSKFYVNSVQTMVVFYILYSTLIYIFITRIIYFLLKKVYENKSEKVFNQSKVLQAIFD